MDGMEDGIKELLPIMEKLWEQCKMKNVKLTEYHKVGQLFQMQEIMTKNIYQ